MSYLSTTILRDRLAAFMEAEPIFTGQSPSFPHPITKIDPTTVDENKDIDICLVPVGMKFEPGSLGGRNAGTLTVMHQIALIVYVFSPTRNQADGDRLGILTMKAVESAFHYEVDKTPGSQGWYMMELATSEHGLDVAYHTTLGYRASIARINLTSRQRKS